MSARDFPPNVFPKAIWALSAAAMAADALADNSARRAALRNDTKIIADDTVYRKPDPAISSGML